jgi:hypothetical protein
MTRIFADEMLLYPRRNIGESRISNDISGRASHTTRIIDHGWAQIATDAESEPANHGIEIRTIDHPGYRFYPDRICEICG